MTKRKYINTMISSFAMLVSSMLVASEASAEFVAQSDDRPPSPSRLIFPDTQEGYHVLAGDLHLHTVFSDAPHGPRCAWRKRPMMGSNSCPSQSTTSSRRKSATPEPTKTAAMKSGALSSIPACSD